MSSAIPTRRATRQTRPVIKEDENANARPSRIITRSKPPSNSGTAAAGTTTRASVLADAAAQNKRKREALGEVTGKAVNNRVKAALDAKGKGKEGVAVKPTKPASASSTATTTTTTSRVPLRPVPKPSSSKSGISKPAKVKSDAVILEPASKAVPVVEIPVKATTTATATTTRRVISRPTTNSAAAPAPATSTTTVKNRRVIQKKVHTVYVDKDPEPPSEEPVTKKRRTSSEAPEEARLEAIAEEPEAPLKDATTVEQAKPVQHVQDWDDLDRDDDDDPLMVSEYVNDIFNYLKDLEQLVMPHENYMINQKELEWKTRAVLVDWLITVHARFKLMAETLFLSVNLVDRFLSVRVVSLAKLQLVGIASLFIAAKMEETVSPSVANFIYCAQCSYTEQEILQAEKYILKTIDWNLSYPSPLNFLRRISKADDYNIHVRTIGKYLLEIGIIDWRLLGTPPSLLAAAAMWLARLILDMPDWTPNLRHFSSYTEAAVLPAANHMLNYILRPVPHEYFYKKYASKKYMKASVYVREWAIERWGQGSAVDLAHDLPQLKEEARQRYAELLEAERQE